MARPIPLRRDPEAFNEQVMTTLTRACIAAAHGKLNPGVTTESFVRKRWGSDEARAVEMIAKAASSPAMTTTTGWAAELAPISTALLSLLVPVSASAALLQRGLQISFGRDAQIKLPTIAPGTCTFVAAGSAIPVQKFAASGPTISPHKMACICELTREMIESSSAESLVRAALVESVGKGLDQILFDNVAGDDVRPAGLRFGVAGLTPAAPGVAAKGQALEDDIVALGTAVSAVASGPFTYVAAVPQAIALIVRTLGTFKDTVLPSAALPAGMVICVADAALAAAIEGPPVIDVSRQVELHRETNPQPIVSGGVTATPVGSVYQTDSVALRLRWPVSWQLRASGAVSWMSSVNW
jgi:Phage capsid family